MAELEEHLDRFTAAGKLVLVVDYASSPGNVAEAYERGAAKGYRATVTDVALDGPPYPAPIGRARRSERWRYRILPRRSGRGGYT